MDYIFPNENEKICLVVAAENLDGVQCGRKLEKDNDLYKKIMEELSFPFHKSVIKLNQCVRNLMKDSDGPNVLLLSEREGSFAECGLRLIEEDNFINYPNLSYVDLVINEERLKVGCMHIFSHELGHVMMENILKKFPYGESSKQHVSMGITDFFMAFSEGWAINFERLIYDSTDYYKNIRQSQYSYDMDIVSSWVCEEDSMVRLRGILKNLFIYKKANDHINELDLSIKDKILLEHTSTTFNRYKIKNAQEMLACEGVIATLFYRINTNKVLQNNYESKAFYNNFLLSNIDKNMEVGNLFNPFENVMLKNLWVMYKMKDKIDKDSNLFIEFIKEWCELFPRDKEEIIKLFVTTTVGKTINNELSEIYERSTWNGMKGCKEGFVQAIKEYRQANSKLCDMVSSGEINIDENVGKEIWIENPNLKIPKCLWGDEEVPLKVNLNTASIYDLMSFPKITGEKATEIIEERDKKCYFKDLKEVGEEYFI